MDNLNIKEKQVVRLYVFPPSSSNAEARVRKVYPNGSVWLSNANMPFAGSINKIFSKEQFEKLTTY